ncbi:hypothetical protein I302_104961 [Kwoniella bestiolae CBS 10118]|uniref:F-box domain-containing protein n=1 Tax=Kwoniella bestiolae CBS 10118 TaxID=1296100 RepID=A0A1B9FRA0_9TREE|nr:hypothetical protein I302_08968 [Kwoniella bestiolae CBS 10118]OCF21295.1 hypothetical protein I302_08968 [Kwoniella bestiolae CBS 10118]
MSDHPTLTDIPNEVVLDHLLHALQLRDIASLSAVNRQFNLLTSDPAFWRSKTLSDFTFPTTSHPTTSSKGWWKHVYLGLLKPKAYVWGSSDNNRLGGAELATTRNHRRYIDIPSEISWNTSEGKVKNWNENLKDSLITALSSKVQPEEGDVVEREGEEGGGRRRSGVVELQAGGWSFTARQSDGSVWVWGQLDGTRPGYRLQSWEDKHCPCPTPTKIPLPCKVESISAGRRHLLVLDSDNLIWELRSWGKAYYHTAPELTAPTGHGTTRLPPHVVQLSTGWQHSAALTSKGDIHVWYPFSNLYENSLSSELSNVETGDEDRGLKYGKVGDNVLVTLPSLPSRPGSQASASKTDNEFKIQRRKELQDQWSDYESSRAPRQLEAEQIVVKIASGEDFVVALKQNGEVWLIRVKEGGRLVWQYMEFFSSPSVTHLTAQFRSFTTYATPTSNSDNSAVYHARIPEYSDQLGEKTIPDLELLESLRNKGIIQVAIGDYHYAALNDKGEMFTWGQGDSGQLGRGQNKSGKVPTRVIFPEDELDFTSDDTSGSEKKGEGAFVFSITAGGWHTGALLLGDLKPRSEKGKQRQLDPVEEPRRSSQEQEQEGAMPGNWPGGVHNPFTAKEPVPVPPNSRGGGPVRAMPMYRIGFAGRGANLGGLGGLGRGHTTTTTPDQDQDQDEGNGAGSGRGRGAAPIFRVGFAGRGANLAAGRGRGVGDGNGQEQGESDGNGNGDGVGRGAAPIFRVGFAGRGANTAAGRGRGAQGGQANEAGDGESGGPW